MSSLRAAACTVSALCALLLGDAAMAAAVPAGLDLGAYRGRVVYLDFWASWCVPCRHSFPWMQAMKDAYAAQGLAVVAIDVDNDQADAQKFLAAFHPSFEVRFDPEGALPRQFHIEGMPTSLLIDRHGTVRYTDIGFRPADGAVYEARLRELLAEK